MYFKRKFDFPRPILPPVLRTDHRTLDGFEKSGLRVLNSIFYIKHCLKEEINDRGNIFHIQSSKVLIEPSMIKTKEKRKE